MAMQDPHVVSLRYRLKTASGISYQSPHPLAHDTAAFRARLADGVLTLEMKDHFASEEDAKNCVKDFLRAWEIHAALTKGPGELSFEFDTAHVIDRCPPPPGSSTILIGPLSSKVALSGRIQVHAVRAEYPSPPAKFAASPLVETLWNRYQLYCEGRELLTNMGYFCLSAVQDDLCRKTGISKNVRQAIANRYAIELPVFTKLGELTSDVGDFMTARKLEKSSQRRPHTTAEVAWIEAVVKSLIQRVAEYDADPAGTLTPITMADFPSV